MVEINITETKLQKYLLKFDGVTCPGCVTAIQKEASQLNKTKFIAISESCGDALIISSMSTDKIKFELHEFEGCCSDCQIIINEVEETDIDTLDSILNNQNNFGLIKKQYQVALQRAIDGIEVACSDSCVCKTTDVDRFKEASEAPSFASVYDLSSHIQEYLKDGMSIIDFGSGTGHDAFKIASIVTNSVIIGIDITPEMVDFANTNAKKMKLDNVSFIEGSDLNDIQQGSQDLIYSNNVFNMLPNKINFLKEIKRVLKPGGILIIADEFAKDHLPHDLISDPAFQCGGISGAENKDNIVKKCEDEGLFKQKYKIINDYNIDYKLNTYQLETAVLVLKK